MDADDPFGTFELDLTAHETRRRAEVLRALGDDWDPVAVLDGERRAGELLYSGLDERQRAPYELLVRAGVLPGGTRGDVTAMPLDPFVDIGRRAWPACPRCDLGSGCAECQAGPSLSAPLGVPAVQRAVAGPPPVPGLRPRVASRLP